MLNNGELHLWRIRLSNSADVSNDQISSWRRVLSGVELQRADSFREERFRWEYVLVHAALRKVLGECLGISAQAVRFRPGSFGEEGVAAVKPALMRQGASGDGPPEVRFNLSHTWGEARIAVGLGLEVGVDVEWQRPIDDLEELAQRVMSPVELAQWLALVPEVRARAFYHLWTRKESYLKAIGEGLYHDLQKVTVPVSADTMDPFGGEFRLVKDETRSESWTVTDVPAPEGYSASICCQGNEIPVLRFREFNLERLLSV